MNKGNNTLSRKELKQLVGGNEDELKDADEVNKYTCTEQFGGSTYTWTCFTTGGNETCEKRSMTGSPATCA